MRRRQYKTGRDGGGKEIVDRQATCWTESHSTYNKAKQQTISTNAVSQSVSLSKRPKASWNSST